MNTMRVVSLFIMILFFSSPSFAQPSERVEMQALRLKEKLSLNEEQTSKVHEIIQRQEKQERKDREEHQGDRREMMKATVARMEKTDAEIEKVLTREQKRKFEDYKEERRQEMRERMKERQR